MGCGISKFERRRHHEDGDLTTTASEINHPQPQVKEKESSPSPSRPRLGGGEGLEGIKIKEDADHNNHEDDDDDEQGDDSFINYPRSPSFREYCTDSELPFGDGDDIDRRHGTNRKIISGSSMSSPKTQYDKVVQSGSMGKDELAAVAKTDYCNGRSGLQMRNVLSNSNHRWRGRGNLKLKLKLKRARITSYLAS